MTAPIERLRLLGRRVYGRLRGCALILLYHRIGKAEADPWSLVTTPEHFEQQLEAIRRYAYPMALGDLATRLKQGAIPRGAVALTFDDGYADNLYAARPLLEHHDVPATVFVCPGLLGYERGFWWDELQRIVLTPGVLPDELNLELAGRIYRWELGADAVYRPETAAQHRSWTAFEKPPTRRHDLFMDLWKRLRQFGSGPRAKLLDQLHAWARTRSDGGSDAPILSREELVHLARGGLVEIGAHTLTHPRLATLKPKDQQTEISQSKMVLEELLSAPITSFAYPYGGRGDYSAASVRLVRRAGFATACSTEGVFATAIDDPHQLPRYYMPDMSGEDLSRLLVRHLRVPVR